MVDEDVDSKTTTFLPLPVVDGAKLTYERFLREFALPKQPCIITNLGRDWAARHWSPEYFLAHTGVNLEHEVSMGDGPYGKAREVETTVGDALRCVTASIDDGKPTYLSAWDYVRGGSTALADDFAVPDLFDRAPPWLSSHPVMGNATVDMRWLYVGTRGSGSSTHVDTNLSSAWLWVASGRKEWICAHGDDHELLAGCVYGGGSSDYGDESPLPDLFASDLFERWPHARSARLFHGFQEAGDICFNPSCCVHAVRNVGRPGDFAVSLTHNFVDASNVADVLRDAVRSLRDELLPMAQELKPKSVLKTISKALHIKRPELVRTLAALPELMSDEHIDEIVRAAAAVEVEPDAAMAVELLLRAHLERSLREVRPAFSEAATLLRRTLAIEL